MQGSPAFLDPLDALLTAPTRSEYRLALSIPTSGQLGLTAPAALASAELATAEVNATGGIFGREVSLVLVDAGGSPAAVQAQIHELVQAQAVEAVVGFHTSDVHRAIERVTAGRVPYLFTPPHEGGSRLAGVGLLGPSPRQQLAPALAALGGSGGRRWVLLGNDYIWPRRIHAVASMMIQAGGGDVVDSILVPFGDIHSDALIATISELRPDFVLLSLVGRDLATFNRAWADSHLRGRVGRICGALDETGLLEIDGDDSGELFTSMDWFATDVDDGFLDRYWSRWGSLAPQPGVYARGCYDGLCTMARLAPADAHALAAFGPRVAAHPRPAVRLAMADGTRLVALGRH
jgi:ABC-type branched-subunit amino acid transport system substrate-binding protein